LGSERRTRARGGLRLAPAGNRHRQEPSHCPTCARIRRRSAQKSKSNRKKRLSTTSQAGNVSCPPLAARPTHSGVEACWRGCHLPLARLPRPARSGRPSGHGSARFSRSRKRCPIRLRAGERIRPARGPAGERQVWGTLGWVLAGKRPASTAVEGSKCTCNNGTAHRSATRAPLT